ncbi:sensor histidine kinase [Blastococcus sp. SYSU D00669]
MSPSARRWAGTRGDAWLAAGLVVLSLSSVLAMPAGDPYRPVDAATLLLAAIGPAALVWRSTAPLAALGVAGAAILANAALGAAIGFLEWPAWIALFSSFDVGGRRVRVAAAAITVVSIAGWVVLDRAHPVGSVPGIVIHFLIAAVIGDLSSRRTRARVAEARRAAESEQHALAAERLLLTERGRLARELHDSLGHTVNVVVLQAGVGRRVFDDDPGYAREALASIETAGRAALDELDRLLRVLQPDGRGSPEAFAPTSEDLVELVERVRSTGREVELRAAAGDLPAGAARAVHRIVQEALTNAVRHTAAGRIRVEIARQGADVLLEVTNECDPVAAPVPGHGLVNMRERARLEGGVLEAGPVEGGFRVRAVLPVAAAVAP